MRGTASLPAREAHMASLGRKFSSAPRCPDALLLSHNHTILVPRYNGASIGQQSAAAGSARRFSSQVQQVQFAGSAGSARRFVEDGHPSDVRSVKILGSARGSKRDCSQGRRCHPQFTRPCPGQGQERSRFGHRGRSGSGTNCYAAHTLRVPL